MSDRLRPSVPARAPASRRAAVAARCARSSARRSSGCRATASAPALSMLGISWGIVSVVMLLAYGNGFRGALDARVSRRVRRRRRRRRGRARPACRPAASAPAGASALTVDDVAGGRRAAAGQERRAPSSCSEFPIVYGNKQSSLPDSRRGAGVRRRCAAETPQPGGRFLDDEDVRLHRRVAFIGTKCSASCSAASPPVGADDPHRRHAVRGRSAS